MNRVRLAVIGCLSVLSMLSVGCTGPKRSIDASAIDTVVFAVTERHDLYVSRDTSLNESERAQYLRSSAILRDLQDTAMGRKTNVPTTATGRTR